MQVWCSRTRAITTQLLTQAQTSINMLANCTTVPNHVWPNMSHEMRSSSMSCLAVACLCDPTICTCPRTPARMHAYVHASCAHNADTHTSTYACVRTRVMRARTRRHTHTHTHTSHTHLTHARDEEYHALACSSAMAQIRMYVGTYVRNRFAIQATC